MVCDVPEASVGAVTERLGPAQGPDDRHERARQRADPAQLPHPGARAGRLPERVPHHHPRRGHHVLAVRRLRAVVRATSPSAATGPSSPTARATPCPTRCSPSRSAAALFVGPGVQVYEGMIIGENAHPSDLNVNACREKKLTNIRAAGRDENVILTPPREMSLERALEWIAAGRAGGGHARSRCGCASACWPPASGTRPTGSGSGISSPRAERDHRGGHADACQLGRRARVRAGDPGRAFLASRGRTGRDREPGVDWQAEIREGMAVFDVAGRQLGRVEDLRGGHFFLTRALLVTERIVVDVAASVASVDDQGVHLRSDREELLTRRVRPPETQSSRPGRSGGRRDRHSPRRRGSAAARLRRRPPRGEAARGPRPGLDRWAEPGTGRRRTALHPREATCGG